MSVWFAIEVFPSIQKYEGSMERWEKGGGRRLVEGGGGGGFPSVSLIDIVTVTRLSDWLLLCL